MSRNSEEAVDFLSISIHTRTNDVQPPNTIPMDMSLLSALTRVSGPCGFGVRVQ